jgi:hypothetical protein
MIWEKLVVAALLIAAAIAVGLRFFQAARKLNAPPEEGGACGQECSHCTLTTPDGPPNGGEAG